MGNLDAMMKDTVTAIPLDSLIHLVDINKHKSVKRPEKNTVPKNERIKKWSMQLP